MQKVNGVERGMDDINDEIYAIVRRCLRIKKGFMRSPHGARQQPQPHPLLLPEQPQPLLPQQQKRIMMRMMIQRQLLHPLLQNMIISLFSALKIYTFCARHARRRTLFDALRISCGVELFCCSCHNMRAAAACYMPRSLRGIPGQEV